ncbi:MAG: FHA domain-containing protein [Phycisphaerae bacterium]|nr:FHA domain-containing protein [Phycisphaerae bacterium]
MSSMEPLRVTDDDLRSPSVEGVLAEQEALNRAMPTAAPLPWHRRILYATWLYLALAGTTAGFVAWAVFEPFINDNDMDADEVSLVNLFLFPAVTAFIALFVAATEGLMCRNIKRALFSGSVSCAIGFVGGLLMLIPATIFYGIGLAIASEMSPVTENGMPTGGALAIVILGRGIAWALFGIVAGIGQGIALRQGRMVVNGLLGGALGGLLGGFLFDPVYLVLGLPEEAAASRALGFMAIGLSVGLFLGLVEQWTKSAWLFMKAGPLAGKQFVLYRNPTVVGSSPKADIYLFKDAAIEPRHALLHARGGRYEIEDCGTADGTYVNGKPVSRQILRSGDQVVVGRTVLEFSLRDNRAR